MAVWLSKIQAWNFPDTNSTYDASGEISDGRVVYMNKPYYYNVTTGAAGTLTRSNVASFPYNGYSLTNAALNKTYSTQQFVVVGCGSAANMDAICGNAANTASVISTLLTFLGTVGYTGVELDWENFAASSCTTTQYNNFRTFVANLSTQLHSNGYQLMVNGPTICATYQPAAYAQKLYRFVYSDIVAYCDYMVMQAYDNQFNFGSGTSISPNDFTTACCSFLLSQVPAAKAIIGMPSYGYYGATGGFSFTETNYNTFTGLTGFGTATRNADYEMNWTNAGIYYDYCDASTMNSKRSLIEAQGIINTSVWYMGGNQWFTGNTEPTNNPSSIANMASITNCSQITI